MKKVKWLFGIAIFIMVFLSACSEDINFDKNSEKNIALVAKMNTGNHWGFVKLGANVAAREFNVNVKVCAPWDEEDVDEQIMLVNEVLKQDIDALILAASDYNKLVEVTEKAYSKDIPVIIIDSEVNTEKIDSYIATDNLDAGKQAGNMLVNLANGSCHVAVISFVKGSRNAVEREEGLYSVISKYPDIKVVAKEYCLSNTELAYNLTRKIIKEHEEVDIIVALNEVSSEGAARAVEEMNLGGVVKLIAFGNTLNEISFLESGTIQAIVLENPFSMGYLGVKYAVDAMHGKKIPKSVNTDSKLIVKENMYLPENQKLLFPITK